MKQNQGSFCSSMATKNDLCDKDDNRWHLQKIAKQRYQDLEMSIPTEEAMSNRVLSAK